MSRDERPSPEDNPDRDRPPGAVYAAAEGAPPREAAADPDDRGPYLEAPDTRAPPAGPTPVLVHLTGPHRGSRIRLLGDRLWVGTAGDAHVHFPIGVAASVGPHHACLERHGDGWSVQAQPGRSLFLNGRRIGSEPRPLRSGDVLEIGDGGPVLRYRAGDPPPDWKTLQQAMQDCIDCARYGAESWPGRIRLFFGALPREVLTRTRPVARVGLAALTLVLLTAVAVLAVHAARLEQRIVDESRRLQTIEAAVQEAQEGLADADLRAQLEAFEEGLGERIEALEARSEAGRRVVAAATPSVIFLQGAFGFRPPGAVGTDSAPLAADRAEGPPPAAAAGPDDRVFTNRFTGSAFVVSGDGLLVTNRHIARPWDFDPAARALVERGYQPVLRLVGFRPDRAEPVEVVVDSVSRTSDLAILRAATLAGTPPLPLDESSPEPGAEVIVMGYPTGLSALLARTSTALVDSLLRTSGTDFWGLARRLSEAGLVRPLATRGIVGQVTPASVVYDAETTRGGSGGPVLDLDGRVVAVTVGVMVDFGGSNLGVPVEEIRRLLGIPVEPEPSPAPPRLPRTTPGTDEVGPPVGSGRPAPTGGIRRGRRAAAAAP